MPHDRNGNEIEVGMLVMLPCRVTAVHVGQDYCNITLETVEPMYPSDRSSTFSVNAKQVVVKE